MDNTTYQHIVSQMSVIQRTGSGTVVINKSVAVTYTKIGQYTEVWTVNGTEIVNATGQKVAHKIYNAGK